MIGIILPVPTLTALLDYRDKAPKELTRIPPALVDRLIASKPVPEDVRMIEESVAPVTERVKS